MGRLRLGDAMAQDQSNLSMASKTLWAGAGRKVNRVTLGSVDQ